MTKMIYWYEYQHKKKAKNDFEKDVLLKKLISNKKPKKMNCSLEIKKTKCLSHFYYPALFFCTKNIRLNVHIILLWKFQTNESLSKLHLIISQTLNLTILWLFTKNAWKNHILFFGNWLHSCVRSSFNSKRIF